MGLMTLFRRPKPAEPLSVDAVQSTALAVPGGSRANVLAKHGVRSLLDQGMTINGDLETNRGAAIDGIVNGDVTVREQSSALLLRASAVVRGTVRAPILMVSGTIEGGIEARFVRLYPGSKVIGRIKADRLVVDDGAQIVNDDVGAGRVLEPALPPPVQQQPSAEAMVEAVNQRDAWRGSPAIPERAPATPATPTPLRPYIAGQSAAAFLHQASR